MVTEEKSIELADQINSIKMILFCVDVDYAKEVVKSMKEKASWQDSAAVLNPSYNPEKTNIVRKQANMLQSLIDFIEVGKEVDKMKKEAAKYDRALSNIQKMFL